MIGGNLRYTRWLMLFAMLLTLLSGASSSALAGPGKTQSAPAPALFYPLDAPAALQAPETPGILRTRSAGLNLETLLGGETLQLNLFDDLNLLARRTAFQTLPDGSQVWQGVLADASTAYPESELTFSITDGQVYGEIHLGTELYRVRSAAEGVYWVQQIDPTAFPQELAPRTPPKSGAPSAPQPPLNPTDDGTVADVMVVYTPKARDTAGGPTSIQNMINTAIAETNQGYANSGINFRVNLVYKGEVGYAEGGSLNWDTALDRLTYKNDGYIDSVHTLRDTYHADFVSMIVGSGTYCGLGWLLQSPTDTSFADYAFTLVSVWCLTGYYTLAHEMGHNMGSAHDRAHSDGQATYSYSYGYQAPNRAFRTIMAYDCSPSCPRVNYWSNPENTYGGQAMGVLYTAPNAADNRRSLNNNALLFTNFRQGVVAPPTNPTSVNPGCTATSGVWQKTCGDPSFTWSGATAQGGIAGYHVYFGPDPAGSATTWVTSAAYNPPAVGGEGSYYLRIQTQDVPGQTSDLQTLFVLKYDATPPVSHIGVSIPRGQDAYLVKWGALDGGVGSILSYNVQYRVGSGGAWTTWFNSTTQTSAFFGLGSPVSLSLGETYYFRVQGTDTLGNQEAYPSGDGDNWFTPGDQFLYAPLMARR
jgi:peptidyl-Asp metalloendopeptidase